MKYSRLEKLWEGTQQLGSLKTIIMRYSKYLKEIPDLSKAVNLGRVDFSNCYILESFPSPLNSESLEYLSLKGCDSLKNFPQIIVKSLPHGIEITVYDCLWNKNLPELDYLDCIRRCYPLKFLPEYIVELGIEGFTMEKLWEGVQSLGSLQSMNMSFSKNLKEIPDLSKATNLKYLDLSSCKSLVTLPSTIGNLQKLETLEISCCTMLEVLPVDVNLSSLETLNLYGCSSLKSFPQLSHSIEILTLDNTAVEEVPCCINMFQRLTRLSMQFCSELRNISPKIFRLTNLKQVDFGYCDGVITAVSDATIKDPYETIEKGNKVDKDKDEYPGYFYFQNCFKLDRDARELIIQSSLKWNVILPGGEVPKYFKHRAFGNSLTVTLPQSSPSHQFLRFNVCIVFEALAYVFSSLCLHFRFNGLFYNHVVYMGWSEMLKNHLVLFSFKFQPTGIPSNLDSNDVEFKFETSWVIKEVGVRPLNVSPSLGDGDRISSETDCNQQFGEKADVAETENKKKRERMASPNLELRLGKGESSSVSSGGFHDSMITVQQDPQIPIARLIPDPGLIWPSSCLSNSEENLKLPFDQIVTETRLISQNMEDPLGREESSSVSSYPCPEGGSFVH